MVSSTHFVLWRAKEFSAAQFLRDVLPSFMTKSTPMWTEAHDGTQFIHSPEDSHWISVQTGPSLISPLHQVAIDIFPWLHWDLSSVHPCFFNLLLLFSTPDCEFAESYNLYRKQHAHGTHLPIITANPSQQIMMHGHCWGKHMTLWVRSRREAISCFYFILFFDPSHL